MSQCLHGTWASETVVLPREDGSETVYVLLVCRLCGHVTGVKRTTPPDFERITYAAPAYEPCDPDETQKINTQPPQVGSSEPPPRQSQRPQKPSLGGFYIHSARKKR